MLSSRGWRLSWTGMGFASCFILRKSFFCIRGSLSRGLLLTGWVGGGLLYCGDWHRVWIEGLLNVEESELCNNSYYPPRAPITVKNMRSEEMFKIVVSKRRNASVLHTSSLLLSLTTPCQPYLPSLHHFHRIANPPSTLPLRHTPRKALP